MSNKKYYWLLELTAILIIISATTIFYLNQNWIGLVFNSDILFIPDMFNDLDHGGIIKDWIIATTGMFFPDWLIYYIAYFFTKKVYFQFLIIACLNTFLLYLMIRLIYSQYFKQQDTLIFSISSIVIFLFFSFNVQEPYVFLMVLGQHMGGFIVGMFYIYLQIKIINNNKYNSTIMFLILTNCISLIMGMSDVLFLIQFLMPILVAYLFLYLNKKSSTKKVFLFSIVPILFFICGFLFINKVITNSKIWDLISLSQTSNVSYNFIKHKLLYFKASWRVFSQYSIITCMYVFFYSVITFIIIKIIFIRKKIEEKNFFKVEKNIFLTVIIFFSVAINIVSFIVLDKDLAVRHLEPFFYFPIVTFFFIALLFKKNINAFIFFKTLAFLYIILSIIYLITERKKIVIKKDFYPYEVSCIDKALKNHGHYGVANYWTARPFTMFSRQKIYITSVFNNLAPFSIASNLKLINSKNAYSFVIMNVTSMIPTPNAIELNETDIININGTPQKKIICGSKKILVYKDNSFKIPVLKIKGDSFYWPAYLLPTQFSNSSPAESIERFVKSRDGQGFVSFGPYVTLLPGKYQVHIVYKSNLPTHKKIGFCDISSGLGNSVSKNFDLMATNNTYRTFSQNFVVPKELDNNSYEIRFYTNGTSNIYLRGISLNIL